MPEVARLVWLDEADARDPALVGAKAARLARARSVGLPVADGFVIPAHASASAMSQGEDALGERGNSGAARTAVYNHQPHPLVSELTGAARKLGKAVVVRSSSRAEAEGVWAGAFSSYVDLQPEEVAAGVIGCWASVFNPGALKRAEALGISPSEVGMAVLVQTRVQTLCGGVASLGEGGEVRVAGMEGHHAPLVAGWEAGHIAIVGGDDSIQAGAGSTLAAELVLRVAHLGRRVRNEVGCAHIEWAMGSDREVYLLQAQPAPDRQVTRLRPAPHASSGEEDPRLLGVVRMMLRYPGPVGERHVWPWAVGLSRLPSHPGDTAGLQPDVLMREIEDRANLLTSQRRQASGETKALERALARLMEGDQSAILKLCSQPETVDLSLAGSHLARLEELAEALSRTGYIPNPGWMWFLDPHSMERPWVRKGNMSRRVGVGRWDPLIHSVITSLGVRLSGHPAAGGWGAGRLRFIRSAADAAASAPREVIAANLPLGNLAPLLWNAAGLITLGGSPGAHLFEVAEWLGVPAVCGVNLEKAIPVQDTSHPDDVPIVAVRGDSGHVTVLH